MNQSMSQADPALDTYLELLSNHYRRRLLVALLDHNPQDDADTHIPDHIVLEDDDLESVQLRMNHIHLPKLEEAGFIEWSPGANEVRKGPRFGEIRPLLELMVNHADELPEGWL